MNLKIGPLTRSLHKSWPLHFDWRSLENIDYDCKFLTGSLLYSNPLNEQVFNSLIQWSNRFVEVELEVPTMNMSHTSWYLYCNLNEPHIKFAIFTYMCTYIRLLQLLPSDEEAQVLINTTQLYSRWNVTTHASIKKDTLTLLSKLWGVY